MNCWNTSKSTPHNVARKGERDGLRTGRYEAISSQAPRSHKVTGGRFNDHPVAGSRARASSKCRAPHEGGDMVCSSVKAEESQRKRLARNTQGNHGLTRSKPIKTQGHALSPDKAWLLGFLAGDGSIQIEADGGAKVSANCGQDEQLARHVAALFREIYGVPCTLRLQQRDPYPNRSPYWQPIVYRRAVAEDLLATAPFGIYAWRVPVRVSSSDSPNVKAAWVSGFADAEGTVAFYIDKARNRASRNVSITSANRAGLLQTKRLLAELGVRTAFSSHARKTSTEHKLHVCHRADLERFGELVGFRCARKQRVLEDALGSYERQAPSLRTEEAEALVPRVLKLRARNHGFAEIAQILGLASHEVPKGVIKRAKKRAEGACLACQAAPALHSVPRVIRGRQAAYVCAECLEDLERRNT